MRVFLCSFNNFYLAVPISDVSSIILIRENTETPVEYNDEYNNKYLSLPLLFNFPAERVKHGIILKEDGDDSGTDDIVTENKNVLLTTEIECEAEIPDEQIYPMPKILGMKHFSAFISGIIFTYAKTFKDKAYHASKADMILLVNPVQLFESIKRNRE